MSTIETKVCDLCGEKIEKTEKYINATHYGVDAHMKCFGVLEPEEVLWLLGLEEVEYYIGDTRGERVRNAVTKDIIKIRLGFVATAIPVVHEFKAKANYSITAATVCGQCGLPAVNQIHFTGVHA